jgi:hypothetical protein
MMETEKHGVWTYNEDPEYIASNAGLPDMLIAYGVTVLHAKLIAGQLAQRYPSDTWEVRNYMSDVVCTLGKERPDLLAATRARHAPRKPRRTLGNRGDTGQPRDAYWTPENKHA